ncbi:MAG: DNA-directed RNA polymerase subunit alpha [Parcubacteria group bacterium]|nr:DNA-directed RNA polymerase subunit alpha [Parcubacteria group bacterium]
MLETDILLPSKPRVVDENEFTGVFEIDGLYPGYGHTLGNSLRRILLSSLPGAAITSVKIDGVSHEFSSVEGVKEDVIMLLLNLKKVRFRMTGDEPQEITLSIKGAKTVTAGDIKTPGQIEVLNSDQYLAEVTGGGAVLNVSMTVQKGLGYATREELQKEKVEVGSIVLDAIFTPIRRVNYEVEDMRVGDRTDHNRLRVFVETDGSLSPRSALEKAIVIMIRQLQAIVGFKEELTLAETETEKTAFAKEAPKKEEIDPELLKTRIETLNLTTRTANALNTSNIRTLGGLVRKKEEDLLDVDGLGEKGIQEIKKILQDKGLSLRQ